MKYLNQHQYEHIPYLTNISVPESELAISGTLSRAGCGICCSSMMIEMLTLESLSLEKCIEYAVVSKSNLNPGTNLRTLGPFIANLYQLDYKISNEIKELIDYLQKGGCAIANIAGDSEGYIGVYSKGGHYVLVISVDGDYLTILDPSYKEGKYEEYGRAGKVEVNGFYTKCHYKILVDDTAQKEPSFHLFSRSF